MGLFSPVWCLRPFVPRDLLLLVFWWGRSQGEGFYSVEEDGVFPGPVGQDVYSRVSRSVPRYMLPVMVEAGSGWRRGEVHGVEESGSWCSHRGWSMPYGVTCTAKGPTASWSLWDWMLLRRATARVWERPSLIHTASARDAAGFRQSVMMPVIVRLWVASDILAVGAADAGDDLVVVEGAGLAPCILPVLVLLGGGVHACVFGLLVGVVCCVEGGGPGGSVVDGAVWEFPLCCPCVQGGCGSPFRLYGVSLVVSATGDEDVGGRQLIHLCGVGQVPVTVILAASFLRVVVLGMM